DPALGAEARAVYMDEGAPRDGGAPFQLRARVAVLGGRDRDECAGVQVAEERPIRTARVHLELPLRVEHEAMPCAGLAYDGLWQVAGERLRVGRGGAHTAVGQEVDEHGPGDAADLVTSRVVEEGRVLQPVPRLGDGGSGVVRQGRGRG